VIFSGSFSIAESHEAANFDGIAVAVAVAPSSIPVLQSLRISLFRRQRF
jgi:hypothetical protein